MVRFIVFSRFYGEFETGRLGLSVPGAAVAGTTALSGRTYFALPAANLRCSAASARYSAAAEL